MKVLEVIACFDHPSDLGFSQLRKAGQGKHVGAILFGPRQLDREETPPVTRLPMIGNRIMHVGLDAVLGQMLLQRGPRFGADHIQVGDIGLSRAAVDPNLRIADACGITFGYGTTTLIPLVEMWQHQKQHVGLNLVEPTVSPSADAVGIFFSSSRTGAAYGRVRPDQGGG